MSEVNDHYLEVMVGIGVRQNDLLAEIRDGQTTLRDQLAMAAMQGDWASMAHLDNGPWSTDAEAGHLEWRAQLYYRLADAMLKTREVRP